jgi:outer membrane protein OmpA-like peptidoglycan-associated protein
MDDIYRLQLARGFSTLEASRKDGAVLTVYDGATSQRIQGAEVWLTAANNAGRFPTNSYSFDVINRSNRPKIQLKPKPFGMLPATGLITDREGSTRLELKIGTTYEVRVYQPGYQPASLRFVFTENGPSRPLAITLQPTTCILVSGRMTTATGEGAGGVPFQFRPQGCNAASISGITDLAGYYEICLAPNCNYLLAAGKPGLETGVAQLSAKQLASSRHPNQDLTLQYEAGLRRRGTDADNAILPLPGITFYGNTASLNEANSGDLELLVQLLTDRPDLKLLLVAHTDGPGDDAALLRLGDQRANSLRESLLRQGIGADRLRTISYGRQYRIKDCTNCTVEDWARNNRMEAKVIGW